MHQKVIELGVGHELSRGVFESIDPIGVTAVGKSCQRIVEHYQAIVDGCFRVAHRSSLVRTPERTLEAGAPCLGFYLQSKVPPASELPSEFAKLFGIGGAVTGQALLGPAEPPGCGQFGEQQIVKFRDQAAGGPSGSFGLVRRLAVPEVLVELGIVTDEQAQQAPVRRVGVAREIGSAHTFTPDLAKLPVAFSLSEKVSEAQRAFLSRASEIHQQPHFPVGFDGLRYTPVRFRDLRLVSGDLQ